MINLITCFLCSDIQGDETSLRSSRRLYVRNIRFHTYENRSHSISFSFSVALSSRAESRRGKLHATTVGLRASDGMPVTLCLNRSIPLDYVRLNLYHMHIPDSPRRFLAEYNLNPSVIRAVAPNYNHKTLQSHLPSDQIKTQLGKHPRIHLLHFFLIHISRRFILGRRRIGLLTEEHIGWRYP